MKRCKPHTLRTPANGLQPFGQRGFSLITTLILLVIVTVLGVAASQLALMSERSTRFDRDQQIAFQAAEAALLDAEFDIRGPNTSANSRVAQFSPQSALGFVDGCGDTSNQRGMCMPAAEGQKPIWYQVNFTDTSAGARTVRFGEFTGRSFSAGSTGLRSEIEPRYIIEVLPDTSSVGGSANVQKNVFRVTAMGFGPRRETQAVVQMIFRKE